MGVSTTFYTIYGLKLDHNNDFYDIYDEVYDDEDTPFVLFDGICNDYIIVGVVLFNSGDMRWGFEGGDQYKEYSDDELLIKAVEYKYDFCKKFHNYSHLMSTPFKIISMVHYS